MREKGRTVYYGAEVCVNRILRGPAIGWKRVRGAASDTRRDLVVRFTVRQVR